MTKREILQTLILQFANNNQSKFARLLGVRAATISTWLKRDTFDLELVYSKCENLSGDWLLSGGVGPMLRTTSSADEEHTAPSHTDERSTPTVTPLIPAAVNDELDSLRAQLRSSREAVGELYEENRRLRAQIAVLQAASATAG